MSAIVTGKLTLQGVVDFVSVGQCAENNKVVVSSTGVFVLPDT